MTTRRTQLPTALQPDLLDRLQKRFAVYPLIQGWSVRVLSVAPGKASMSLAGGPTVLNLMGTVNGGVLATLADMTCAVALCTAFDGAMPFATSDLHIRYLEPALGEVVAEAEVVRLSPRNAVIECRLKCGGQAVALCTTHFAIRPPKTKAAEQGPLPV